MSRLSVLISTRNRARELKRCLGGLTAQDADFDEVIVVDDGSIDDTADVAHAAGCTVVRLPSRAGICAARNACAAAASGDIFAFVDDDAEVQPGWAAALREAFADGAAIVGGGILGPGPRSLAEWYVAGASWHDQPGRNGFLPYVCGANFAIRRDVFERLGGFDEALPASEDLDLSFRAQLAGYELSFVPAAAVVHWPPRSVRGMLRQQHKYARGDRVAEAKYGDFPFQYTHRSHRGPVRVFAATAAAQLMVRDIRAEPRRLALPFLDGAAVVARRTAVRRTDLEFLAGLRQRPAPIRSATEAQRNTARSLPDRPILLLLGDDRIVASILRLTLESSCDVSFAPSGLERQALARWDQSPPWSVGLAQRARRGGWPVPVELTALRLERERPRTWGEAFLTLHRIHAWLMRRHRFGLLAVGDGAPTLAERLPDVPIVSLGDDVYPTDRLVLRIRRRELLRDRKRVMAELGRVLDDAA